MKDSPDLAAFLVGGFIGVFITFFFLATLTLNDIGELIKKQFDLSDMAGLLIVPLTALYVTKKVNNQIAQISAAKDARTDLLKTQRAMLTGICDKCESLLNKIRKDFLRDCSEAQKKLGEEKPENNEQGLHNEVLSKLETDYNQLLHTFDLLEAILIASSLKINDKKALKDELPIECEHVRNKCAAFWNLISGQFKKEVSLQTIKSNLSTLEKQYGESLQICFLLKHAISCSQVH